VQCRFGTTLSDIYVDALSQLEITLDVQMLSKTSFKGSVKATGSLGTSILGKLGLQVAGEAGTATDVTKQSVGRDVNDLRFVAQIIRESGRRLIVEDFHYLDMAVRRSFAFDLKLFYENQVNVIIVGVWSMDNLLVTLNPDLTARIEELTIEWSEADLARILDKGGGALKITFDEPLRTSLVKAAFGNAGILQNLVLQLLDDEKIYETQAIAVMVMKESALHAAAKAYSLQLDPLYQNFARNVSEGIRKRSGSTGIYAHAMAAIMAESDDALRQGISAARIFEVAHRRQPRIQFGNLKLILEKIDQLQVDDAGRGLVITYNTATELVTVVDRQVLLYRKYSTTPWPWEALIAEAEASENSSSAKT
jgi:hypothetical protein